MRRRRSAPIRLWVFLTVTLPLALPGIIAGVVLCFARALGEFGATITFVSNIPGETQTISAAIYTLTQVPGGDAAAGRLVLISIALGVCGVDRVGMARPPRRDPLSRGLIVLAVDVEKQLGALQAERQVSGARAARLRCSVRRARERPRWST